MSSKKLKSDIDSVIIDMILDHYNIQSLSGKREILTGKACDYIEAVQDDTAEVGYRRYEHGYHHLSGGGDPAEGPNECNNDFVQHYLLLETQMRC